MEEGQSKLNYNHKPHYMKHYSSSFAIDFITKPNLMNSHLRNITILFNVPVYVMTQIYFPKRHTSLSTNNLLMEPIYFQLKPKQ